MAVKDDDACRPTEGLVLTSQRRHFRTIVSPVHWQLRGLIGVDKQSHHVYYPAGKGNLQIKRLNTKTRETETVKLLSFSPRCLVAENGWICCGGESGEYASFKIETPGQSRYPVAEHLGLNPERRLPLDYDFTRPGNNEALYSYLTRPLVTEPVVASRKTFGKERVNCITLWFRHELVRPYEGAYTQAVAVLANNDKHVTIVGLLNGDAFDEVEYDDAVNRAVLSPDGELLAGVSDDPYLYIHQRQLKYPVASSSFRTADRPIYEWKLARKIFLPGQRADDKGDSRGSFALSFSNTGRYLAVGTQYGMICIFATLGLTDDEIDPMLTSFQSTRRGECGAVRVLSFCPGPFDLLAWTEERGRIGVVDVRDDFNARQILYLDQQADYEHFDLIDRSSIDPRLLDSRNERDTLASTLASSLDLSSDSRPPRSENLDRYNYPFNTEDTVVLEAIQDHRRRREQRLANAQAQQRASAQAQVPSIANTESGAAGARLSIPELSTATSASRGARQRSASVSRAFTDILSNIRDQRERQRDYTETSALRDYQEALDRQERLRARREEIYGRQAANPMQLRRTAAAETDSMAPRRALMSRLMAGTTSAQTQTQTTNQLRAEPSSAVSGVSGWSEIEALYQLAYEGGMYASARADSGEQRGPDLRRRDRADRAAMIGSLFRRAQGDWDANATRRAWGRFSTEAAPEMDETSGMAWSADGRILYVGAEDGIYEFHVDVLSRKLSPSLVLR